MANSYPDMPDLYMDWQGDLLVTPNGSVQMASSWDHYRQRIVRRLVTNSAQVLPDGSTTAPDYIFDTAYGFGLAALVDQNPTEAFLQSLTAKIRAAVLADVAVDPGSLPTITIQQPNPSTYIVNIALTLLDGTPGTVQIALT